MKVIVCKEWGPPERLAVEDWPSLPLAPGQLRITVKAAGMNFPDALIVQNRYQLKPPLPFVPGAEVAGVVSEVGAGVSRYQPGDAVTALGSVGGYATEFVADEASVHPIVPGMPFDEASGFILAYGTSMHALRQRAQLKAGETLLVLGASGGVGLAAVQIGKAMGARVLAAASSEEKLALCQASGADALINYSSTPLKDAVRALTGGQGADVIYDPVGGDLTQQCLSCLAWEGRHLVVGFSSGTIPEVALNRVLLKSSQILGVFWGAWIQREPEASAANLRQLAAWYGEGRIKVWVSLRVSLDQVPEALGAFERRSVTGKAVIVM